MEPLGPKLLQQHGYLQIDFYSTLVLEEIPKKIVLLNIRTSCDFLMLMTHTFFFIGWENEAKDTQSLIQDVVCFARGILATSQLDLTEMQLMFI